MDQLPRLGKRELICLLLFTCKYVVSVWRGFLFLWVLGMGYVILLWHSLSLPYNYLLLDQQNLLYIFTFRHENVRTNFQQFVITGVQPISPATAALGVYLPTLSKYLAALF